MAQDPQVPLTREERLARIRRLREVGGAAPTDTEPTPVAEPTPTLFGTLLDYLGRFGAATSGGILAAQRGQSASGAAWEALRGGPKASFVDVLAQAGMDPGVARTVAGFALDATVDPLNAVPVLGWGAKAATLARQGGRAAARGIASAARTATPLSPIAAAVDDIAARVTPFYNTSEAYQQAAGLRNAQVTAAKHHELDRVVRTLTPLLREAAPDASAKAISAVEHGAIGAAPPDIQALAKAVKAEGERRATRETAAGVLSTVRPDYVPRAYTNIPAPTNLLVRASRPKFQKARKFETPEAAQAAGYERDTNLIRVLAQRAADGERQIIAKQFTEQLLNAPELASVRSAVVKVGNDGKAVRVAPAHFKTIDPPAVLPEALRQQLSNIAFEPRVAEDLHRFFTPARDPGAFAHAADQLQGMWKSWATVVRPAFHFRNLLSNAWLMAAGDVSVPALHTRFAQAMKLITTGDAGRIGRYASADVLAEAKRLGVIGAEFGIGGDFANVTEEAFRKATRQFSDKEQLLHTVNVPKRVADLGRTVGTQIEDVSRLALFTDQLLKGKSFEDAAFHTHKWLINYAEHTPSEQTLKRIVPFYTWARRSVPLILEATLKNPQLVAAQGKLVNIAERDVPAEQRVPEGERPGYLQSKGIWQEASSVPGVSRYRQLGLPGADVNVLPVPGGVMASFKDLLGRVGPVKAPLEIGVNRDLMTGNPVYRSRVDELVPATGVLAAAAEKGFAQTLGMAKVGNEWRAPAALNHLAKTLIPMGNALGKAVAGPAPGQEEASKVQTPLGPMQRELFNMLAIPSVQQDTARARRKRIADLRQKKRNERRDAARKAATAGGDQ